jgi:spore coat protein A
MNFKTFKKGVVLGVTILEICALSVPSVMAQPLPGGTLDPLTIPKYVTPLVIPPVMNNNGEADSYDIAVRQFNQQILPAGFPWTTVWSYGPAADAVPADAAPHPDSQFNYPAYTIETTSGTPVNVRWINDLVDAQGNPLPHLLGPVVDQTLHWANPGPTPCVDTTKTKDCATNEPTSYTGPVPIVTHVHGAHVQPHSDGYPEAWWLPAGVDSSYESSGTLFDDATGANPGDLGYADYSYVQTQPATTLWYHDHTLGMTRLNVYAGPAGFWLIRGGTYDAPTDGVLGGAATLPGPAPVSGQGVLPLNTPGDPVRNSIREIPVVIQDRSFNDDGSLFYPDNRAFFEGLTPAQLQIPFIPDPTQTVSFEPSDIAPIWNPEAFFNTMVVNGVTWPNLEVAPALYRLRLLNGCNSRFLNLSLKVANKQGRLNKELYIYQIGGDQGFLPQVVEIKTGKATPLPGDGLIPLDRLNPKFKDQALLLGLAERADVIVDFRGLKNGTVIRMVNTAPDAPFGGFPDIPADPATTGQVMQFVVNSALLGQAPTDPVLADGVTPNPAAATDPYSLVPSAEPANTAALADTKTLSLNEEESGTVCVTVDAIGNVVEAPGAVFDPDPLVWATNCAAVGGVPFAPKAALLGTFDPVTGVSTPMLWSQPMTERPLQGNTEQWDIYNLTVDGHPIHLHLVRYQVVNRQALDPVTSLPVGLPLPPEANELGYKDTVIAYPGEVTRLKATFDIAGLYVWHCHIVEHEDNEMMRPYCVDAASGVDSCPDVP